MFLLSVTPYGLASSHSCEKRLSFQWKDCPCLGRFFVQFKVAAIFFSDTVTRDAYHTMLTSHCIRFLTRHRSLSKTTFRRGDAASHVAKDLKQLLRKKFGWSGICRHLDLVWPARSPDLFMMDFFYWRYMKETVSALYSWKLPPIDDLKTARAYKWWNWKSGPNYAQESRQ